MQLFSAAVKNAERNIFETKLQSLLSQQSNFKIAERMYKSNKTETLETLENE
jgi:hypothetical protein